MKKKKSKTVIISLEAAMRIKGRSDFKKIESTSDEEISRQIASDPDLYELTDEEIKEFKRVHHEKDDKQ